MGLSLCVLMSTRIVTGVVSITATLIQPSVACLAHSPQPTGLRISVSSSHQWARTAPLSAEEIRLTSLTLPFCAHNNSNAVHTKQQSDTNSSWAAAGAKPGGSPSFPLTLLPHLCIGCPAALAALCQTPAGSTKRQTLHL